MTYPLTFCNVMCMCIGSDDEDGGGATYHSQVVGEAININTTENTTEEASVEFMAPQSESV